MNLVVVGLSFASANYYVRLAITFLLTNKELLDLTFPISASDEKSRHNLIAEHFMFDKCSLNILCQPESSSKVGRFDYVMHQTGY